MLRTVYVCAVAKVRSAYVCQKCEYSQVGWSGRCPNCGQWGTLVETLTQAPSGSSSAKVRQVGGSTPVNISSVKSADTKRTITKIPEFDRVLGGGLVPGQVVLIAGEPGIGKSTILLQLADKLGNMFYASGEESAGQIALRAQRLGVKDKTLNLLEATDIDSVISAVGQLPTAPSAVVIDSIQTMATSDLSGMAGSVGQVRECAYRLVRLAKSKNIPIFIVGHVTKQGSVAGPAVLAHLVDTVLWFEGDKNLALRLLRAVKNRFGPTDEVGVFTMEDKGLSGIRSPEKAFIGPATKEPGRAVSVVLQGTRPLLVEVQSLVIPTRTPYPRRVAQGIDSKRLELLLAILAKHCGIQLFDYDCFVNVTGGITIKDTGMDLAICASLASSYRDKPVDPKTAFVGEVGLLGEVRDVAMIDKRIKEAKALGYTSVITRNTAKYVRLAITTS